MRKTSCKKYKNARRKTYGTHVQERNTKLFNITYAHKDLIACFKRVHKIATEKP